MVFREHIQSKRESDSVPAARMRVCWVSLPTSARGSHVGDLADCCNAGSPRGPQSLRSANLAGAALKFILSRLATSILAGFAQPSLKATPVKSSEISTHPPTCLVQPVGLSFSCGPACDEKQKLFPVVWCFPKKEGFDWKGTFPACPSLSHLPAYHVCIYKCCRVIIWAKFRVFKAKSVAIIWAKCILRC